MGYVERMLADGERVIVEAHRHMAFMLLKVLPLVLLTIVLIAAGGAVWAYIGGFASYIGIVLLIVSLVPLGMAIFKYLSWKMERYIVTNFRILQVEGILNRRTFDSALEMVNDVQTSQSVFGRMFNFGDITVITGSDAGLNKLWGIASPFEFKKALMSAKLDYSAGEHLRTDRDWDEEPRHQDPQPDRNDDQDTQRVDPPADDENPSDASSTVVALTELRNAGVLSQEEFEEKMGQLVDRPTDNARD